MYSVQFPMKSSAPHIGAFIKVQIEEDETNVSLVYTCVNESRTQKIPLQFTQENDLLSKIKLLTKKIIDAKKSKKEVEEDISLLKRKLEKYCIEIPTDLFTSEPTSPNITLLPSTSDSFQDRLRNLILETRKSFGSILMKESHLLPPSIIKEEESISLIESPKSSCSTARGSSVIATIPPSYLAVPANKSKDAVDSQESTARGSSLPQSKGGKTPSIASHSVSCGTPIETLYAEELYQMTRLINSDRSWRIFLSPSIAIFANITNFASLILAATLPPCSEKEFSNRLSFIKHLDNATAALAFAAVLTSYYGQIAFFSMSKLYTYKYSNPSQMELSAEIDHNIKEKYGADKTSPSKIDNFIGNLRNALSPRHVNQIRKNMLILAEKIERDSELIKCLSKETEESKKKHTYVLKLLNDDSGMISKLHILGTLITTLAAGGILAIRLTQDKAEAQCTTKFTQDLAIYTAIPFIVGILGTMFFGIDASRKRAEIRTILRPDPSRTLLLNSEEGFA